MASENYTVIGVDECESCQPVAPRKMEVVNPDGSVTKIYQTGDVPLEFLTPCMGIGFMTISMYLDGIHTMGCASRVYSLFSNWEQLSCKPARYPNSTNACCVTNMTKCECVYPPTLTKGIHQICCLDIRYGIPCDPEVPFLVNLAGYTVFYKTFKFSGKCCASSAQLEQDFREYHTTTSGKN